MTFDRRVEDLLERMRSAGVDVGVTSTGGIVSCSNGCRIRVFVRLVQELHRLHREEPIRTRLVISSRGESGLTTNE